MKPTPPPPGIQCPKCGGPSIKTIDSRPKDDMKRRRRECAKGHRFTTLEQVEAHVLHRSRESWFGKLMRCLPDDRHVTILSICASRKGLVTINASAQPGQTCQELILTSSAISAATDAELHATLRTFWAQVSK